MARRPGSLKEQIGDTLTDMGVKFERDVTIQVNRGPEVKVSAQDMKQIGRAVRAVAERHDREAPGANSVAGDMLKAFVERIERLEGEKAALGGDIRDVYAEAKGNGFDTKAMRKLVALRKKDHAERKEEEAILDLYMQALGMS